MADSDYTIIKPVETLQSVTNLTPAGQREERRQRELRKRRKHHAAEPPADTISSKGADGEESEQHSIDYCA